MLNLVTKQFDRWLADLTATTDALVLRHVTEENFEMWLEGQEGVVGYASNPTACPLANFIKAVIGQPHAQVSASSEYVSINGRVHGAPKWFGPFMNFIDTRPFTAPVDKSDCLKFFEQWHTSVYGKDNQQNGSSGSDGHA